MKHLLPYLTKLRQTGAIAPSSPFLTKNMAGRLKQELEENPDTPLNLLEIGPGTGVLTKQLVEHLRPQDTLDLVEIEESFYERLIELYGDDDNIHVYHTDFLNFDPAEKYHIIFSSLPYEGIPNDETRELWKKKLEYCQKGGSIVYYKYINFKNFRCNFEEEVVDEYKADHKWVLLNVPPARMYTLELDEEKELLEESE